MADEMQVTVPGPDGNHMGIRMGSRSIQGPVLGVIILVLIGGLGWLSYDRTQVMNTNFNVVRDDIKEVKDHIQKLYERQDAMRHEFQGETKELSVSMQQQTRDISLELKRQDNLVQEQTVQLTANRTRLEDRLEAYVEKLHQWLATINHNLKQPPEQQMPLGVPVPSDKGSRHEGR